MRISSLPFCFFLPPSPSVWHRRKGDGGESVACACVCVVLKVLQFERSLQLRHCILVAPIPSLCKSPILPFILNTEAHTSMHARIHLEERATQMTAQHSDLVSMWPRKIKHDSLRTAMGTKSLVQSIQSGQCTWASSQATRLTSTWSGRRFSRNLQFRVALLRS